jgi:hypothetical protein
MKHRDIVLFDGPVTGDILDLSWPQTLQKRNGLCRPEKCRVIRKMSADA